VPACAPVAVWFSVVKWMSNVALPVFAACPASGVPLTLAIAPVTYPEGMNGAGCRSVSPLKTTGQEAE